MAKDLPDPSRRSFITRLTKSFLEMAREVNRLAEEWSGDQPTLLPQPAPMDPIKQLEHQQIEPLRALATLPPRYLIFLLQCFRKPKTIAEIPPGPYPLSEKQWEDFTGEHPLRIIERLQTVGVLVRSDLPTHLVHKFSHLELAAMERTRRLPRRTTKQEMAVQLAQAYQQEMWAMVDDLFIFECAPFALSIAEACLERDPVAPATALAAEEAPDQASDASSEESELRKVIIATLKTARDGVIGNRVDNALVALISYVLGTTRSEASEQTDPISPLPTPQPDTPAPEPLPKPQRQLTPRPRSTPIPPGEFWMGSDKDKDPLAYDGATPQHKVYLPSYRIARYPVTVAQFAQFSKATGYQTAAEKEGWAYSFISSSWQQIKGAYWAHPRGPEGDVQNKANHPVTCVSWVDVNEFCRWAGVRLVSEAEWEKAARGIDDRIYPWGNEAPDEVRCNFNRNINDTTSVNYYPQGKSFYGVWDMAGNVWEWTHSLYKGYPYDPNDGREDPAAVGRRVVRGGSWNDNSDYVRSAYRGHVVIDSRSDNVGFRVVAPGS